MRVLLAILIVTIALIGCNQSNTPPIKQPTALQLAEFSRNASITLPTSAHAGWHEENGIDDAILCGLIAYCHQPNKPKLKMEWLLPQSA